MRSRGAVEGVVTLGHGGGGRLTHELVARHFGAGAAAGARLDDAARLDVPGARLAFTTDSFVVTPRFFPGGDIGRLAVCGTVNDLACMGARPVALSVAVVIEEGLREEELARVAQSMAATCDEAGVRVVTGDTKVVERGSADGLFINTSGVGVVREGIELSGSGARPGDAVLVTGPVGEHGLAVMVARHGLASLRGIESDCAPLWDLAERLLEGVGDAVHVLRDPTRGGLAASLNEIAEQSRVRVALDLPSGIVTGAVGGACELLGLDPLTLASEGRLVVVVEEAACELALSVLRGHPLGRHSMRIGQVVDGSGLARVTLATVLGTERVLDMPTGESLPRIC